VRAIGVLGYREARMPAADPALGLPERTSWRGYQVKGNLLAARARYAKERWGNAGCELVASSLEGEARAAFTGTAMPFAWYSFATLAAIDRAIVFGPMGGDLSQMKHFGSTIARYDLSTIYKVLLKVGSPSFVLKRVNIVYSTYIRGGAMAATHVTKEHAMISLAEGDFPFYFCEQGIPGWFSAAVELSGGKDVQVDQIECVHRGAAHCVWEARWA
jgi:hypothetical protein